MLRYQSRTRAPMSRRRMALACLSFGILAGIVATWIGNLL